MLIITYIEVIRLISLFLLIKMSVYFFEEEKLHGLSLHKVSPANPSRMMRDNLAASWYIL
jgi:hypothetical protein